MSDYIPAGAPLDTVEVDNTSTARSAHANALDLAAQWLTMVRRIQQPVSFQYVRTGGTEASRYQTVMVPPGATHVRVSCLYSGGDDVGPTFDVELPPGAGYVGVDSQLPAQVPDPNDSIHNAGWLQTSWVQTKDTPIADETAHLNVADIAGRNPDEWQVATVRMTFSPSDTSYSVHAWATWPEFFDPTSTP